MFLEVAKKMPLNRDLEKQILRLAVRVNGNNIETVNVTEVKDGKFDEWLARSHKVQMEYFNIEGMHFDLKFYQTGADALALLGLSMPEQP